jgi:hypothetical protein
MRRTAQLSVVGRGRFFPRLQEGVRDCASHLATLEQVGYVQSVRSKASSSRVILTKESSHYWPCGQLLHQRIEHCYYFAAVHESTHSPSNGHRSGLSAGPSCPNSRHSCRSTLTRFPHGLNPVCSAQPRRRTVDVHTFPNRRRKPLFDNFAHLLGLRIFPDRQIT